LISLFLAVMSAGIRTNAMTQHTHDATKNAISRSYPPGKEAIYLRAGQEDKEICAQPLKRRADFCLQRRVKDTFNPNDVEDRIYFTLPGKTR